MDVDFVFFDLDDTLIDHRHAEREALSDLRMRYLEVLGHLSVDELQARYHAINAPLWRQYSNGKIEKEALKRERFARLLDDVGADHADALRIGSTYLQRYAEHWAYVDGAQQGFTAVADRFPVGILTNGFAETQAQKLKRFPELRERSEVIVVSEETGHMKPHPHVFAAAADRAKTKASRILYVGDSWRSDVEGGRRAGWRVGWFARDGLNGRVLDDRTFAFQDWTDLSDRLLPSP